MRSSRRSSRTMSIMRMKMPSSSSGGKAKRKRRKRKKDSSKKSLKTQSPKKMKSLIGEIKIWAASKTKIKEDILQSPIEVGKAAILQVSQWVNSNSNINSNSKA